MRKIFMYFKTNLGRNRNYFKAQRKRSLDKYKKGEVNASLQNERKKFNVKLIAEKIDISNISSALVIGCRNSVELDLLQEIGIKKVVGIDLFSFDDRIKIMDMHDMSFSENFDIIFCSHSLEHALDFDRVIKEIKNVSEKETFLFIEVPTNYATSNVDIHDFKKSKNIIDRISKTLDIENILLQQDLKKGDNYNFAGTDIARLLIKTIKQ